MINTCACDLLKGNDYKSIALPAELQGHPYCQLIFIAKVQINQCLKNLTVMLAAVAARSDSASCSPLVTNLSCWSRCLDRITILISIVCLSSLKQIKNGVEGKMV
jgi:hypothetical protein